MSKTPIHSHSVGNSTNPALTRTLVFLAFAIPVALLLYGLYINFLPFGYDKAYSLNVNEAGDISPLSNKIYLTNLQGRKLIALPEGVEGQVNLVIEQDVVLKNASVSVAVEGEGVYLGVPLKFDEKKWGAFSLLDKLQLNLTGNAYNDDFTGCIQFDASKEQYLSFENSEDLFESGPMSFYVKWNPSERSKVLGNGQQLMGHYNWEIWQNSNNVQFRVGRMNNESGPFYSISYPIGPDFFMKEHELIAVYSPDQENGEGYMQLWVDGNFAGRQMIGKDIIYTDYNSDKPLSMGWTPHNYGKNPYFDGCINRFDIYAGEVSEKPVSAEISASGQKITIPIIGKGKLTSISVEVKQ